MCNTFEICNTFEYRFKYVSDSLGCTLYSPWYSRWQAWYVKLLQEEYNTDKSRKYMVNLEKKLVEIHNCMHDSVAQNFDRVSDLNDNGLTPLQGQQDEQPEGVNIPGKHHWWWCGRHNDIILVITLIVFFIRYWNMMQAMLMAFITMNTSNSGIPSSKANSKVEYSYHYL